eukprot:symbB.v1.2.037883.t1/scaffold5496.1/size26437/3
MTKAIAKAQEMGLKAEASLGTRKLQKMVEAVPLKIALRADGK